MHILRKLALVYMVLFLGVVSLGYIPGLTASDGRLLGLFHIELRDDLLHLASAIWAGLAAWRSTWASDKYFKLFGPVYFSDGVLGLVAGNGFLDLGIFEYGPAFYGIASQFFANLPHLLIGGIAVWVGYVLARRVFAAGRHA
jgi:hypothetical protein